MTPAVAPPAPAQTETETELAGAASWGSVDALRALEAIAGVPLVRLPLTMGRYAIIEQADHWRVIGHKWSYSKRYAVCAEQRQNKTRTILLHRLLMAPPPDLRVDHRNHEGLDCRRANLRVVTHAQNLQNRRGPEVGSSTGYRNVYRHAQGVRRYQVKLVVGGRPISCGYYVTAEDAHDAAIQARRRYMTHAPECVEAIR